MKDETYVFISDVKEKGSIGRSARHRKTHTGKGGRVRLPSDNLSKKELKKMSGECKSYRLNEPMGWNEFKAMPDDIQITYIKLLREKFDVPDVELYKMFGTDKDTLSRYFKKLNLRVPRKNSHRKWKKEEWFAWVHGVEKLPTPFIEEIPVEETIRTEPEVFVEDDLPFDIVPVEEQDCVSTFVPMEQCKELEAENALLKAQIDGLQKANDALMERHENDCGVIENLRLLYSEQEEKVKILEAKMEIVQMIFGRK